MSTGQDRIKTVLSLYGDIFSKYEDNILIHEIWRPILDDPRSIYKPLFWDRPRRILVDLLHLTNYLYDGSNIYNFIIKIFSVMAVAQKHIFLIVMSDTSILDDILHWRYDNKDFITNLIWNIRTGPCFDDKMLANLNSEVLRQWTTYSRCDTLSLSNVLLGVYPDHFISEMSYSTSQFSCLVNASRCLSSLISNYSLKSNSLYTFIFTEDLESIFSILLGHPQEFVWGNQYRPVHYHISPSRLSYDLLTINLIIYRLSESPFNLDIGTLPIPIIIVDNHFNLVNGNLHNFDILRLERSKYLEKD